jgi:hypothetical protein
MDGEECADVMTWSGKGSLASFDCSISLIMTLLTQGYALHNLFCSIICSFSLSLSLFFFFFAKHPYERVHKMPCFISS